MLEATGLRKSFQGVAAVDDVDLTVEEGEILGLIGSNGAGKTTLFNLLAGTMQPESGTIILDGINITDWTAHRVSRAGLTRTFQIARPFSGVSVIENVAIGALWKSASMPEAFEIAEEVLERVGLESRMYVSASTLTEGDRKRLEMAKALATRPRLLLLDEILAGLAPEDVTAMVELIAEIRSDIEAIIMIEHRVQAVLDLADRIKVLHLGQTLADGLPAEIASNPEVIDVYLGRRRHGGA